MPATEGNLFLLFTRPLNETGIPYIVTGSVASIAYGEARLTHDVDLVVEIAAADIVKLEAAFPQGEFYLPPPEVIRIEIGRPLRGHFNIIHQETGFKADMYPCGRDSLSLWGLQNARRIVVEGSDVWLAPPAYVILRKLEYFREGGSEKHLRDIDGILTGCKDALDLADLEQRAQSLGLLDEWRAALSGHKA